jgi:hypothetical protein
VFRSLIERIELHPGSEGKSVDALLYGDLAEILALCASTDDKGKLHRTAVPGSQLSVVAGARNRLDLQLRLLTTVALERGVLKALDSSPECSLQR